MERPGFLNGYHYSAYWPRVQELKKADQRQELEQLLLALCNATEVESNATRAMVAPAYYLELAILYRKMGVDQQELTILTRYVNHEQQRARRDLVERLEKVRARIAKHQQSR
jgi:hypothetical protein